GSQGGTVAPAGGNACAPRSVRLDLRPPRSPTAPIDTREERIDNSLVAFERGQNIVENRRGGRSAPTTVNSSVRTREHLTTAAIERLMQAPRQRTRHDKR